MEQPARDTLQQCFTIVTGSGLNPGWLARELFQAGIIDEALLRNAENELFDKQERLSKLLLAVRDHGRSGVFQQFVGILKNSDTHSYLGENIIGTYKSKGGQFTVTQPQVSQELAGPISTGLAEEASSSAAVPEYYQSTVNSHIQSEHQSRPEPYTEGDYPDLPPDSESLLKWQTLPKQASSSGSKIPLTSPPVNPTAMDRSSIAHFSSPAGVSQVNSPENLLVGSTVDPPVNEQPASLVPGVQPSGAGDMEVKSTEYQVFRNHFHELAMGITDPTMLGSMLFSAELIDLDIQSKLPGTSLSIFEKNQMLLSAVGQQILLNPIAAFATLLEVLESEPGCKDLAGTLNKTHSMMKSLSVSGSSSGTSMARAGNSAQLQHSRSTDNRQPPSWTWDPTFRGATYQTGETRSPDQCSPAPLDEYAEYLRDYYSQMEMPCAISNWPQVPLQKYIDLAVIRTDQLTPAESSEVTKATIHGCIDDICKVNEPIELCDILEPEGKETLRRVLIEGAPGIGKSTLAWIVCRKWGKCILFHKYQLVVLLRFRDKSVQDARDVNDLFCYPPDSDTQRDIVKEIRRSNGQGLLLIFEGYDELPVPKRKSDSVFHKILDGRYLTRATVIITTRPTASTELRSICAGKTSRRIEVLGFGETEIKEYIQCRFRNEKTRDDFQQYLAFHPHIHKMMYVPLNCAVVIEVYLSSMVSDAPAPKTITDLYSALIIALLQRYLNKHKVYIHRGCIVLHGFKSLQCIKLKPVYEQFLHMCRLAYEGIVKRGTMLIFHDLPNHFDSLGLMRSANELYVTHNHHGVCSSYNFLHLTIQEYLAAFHIAQQSTHKQIAFLEEYIDSKKMQTVLAFLSGLTETGKSLWNVVGFFAQHRKMDAASLENTHCIKLPVLQWLFESQDPIACDSVLGSTGPIGFRYDGSALPFHFFVLGYCIVNSRCSWELHIRLPTGTVWVEMLLKGFTCKIDTSSSSRAKGIKALNISHCELPSEVFELLRSIPTSLLENVTHLILHTTSLSDGVEPLAELLSSLPNLQRLVVRHTQLSHGGAVKVVRPLARLRYIREVVIKNAGIGMEDFISLKELLSKSRSIKLLDVGMNSHTCEAPCSISPIVDGIAQNTSLVAVVFPESVLTYEDTISLAETLKFNTTLRKLCISYCKMKLEDAIYLIETLKTAAFKRLHSLYMAGCNIQDQGATSLVKAVLVTGSILEALDLSQNSIGVDGANAIAKMLQGNTSLQQLFLADNQFGSKGAVSIAKALEENHISKIEILKMSGNSIAPTDEFLSFADSIGKCTSLHDLYLDNCDIQTEGAEHLAKLLETNGTLVVVSLSRNPIGIRGAAAFAQTLRSNKTLLELWLDDTLIGTEGACILIDTLHGTVTYLKVLYLSNECKPEHFDLQSVPVTFLKQHTDKHLIPPIAPLFTANRHYFTPCSIIARDSSTNILK